MHLIKKVGEPARVKSAQCKKNLPLRCLDSYHNQIPECEK